MKKPKKVSELARQVSERVRYGQMDNSYVGAAEIIRRYRTKSRSKLNSIEPWASLIDASPPTSADIAELKGALIDALQNGDDSSASNAAFALAELRDDQLTPLLRAQLHMRLRAMMRTYGVVWNLIHALQGSGETILSGTSRSITDVNKAIESAREYLAKHGIVVPW